MASICPNQLIQLGASVIAVIVVSMQSYLEEIQVFLVFLICISVN